ncbi:MAG: metallophosphoesterase family protein [Nanoarchaeota archaeon]
MVRIAVISDIHGNLPALEAVLKDIDSFGGIEQIISLGDNVGYGPYPNEVLDLLRSRKVKSVKGNHDAALFDGELVSRFNKGAERAIDWTNDQLFAGGDQTNAEYLESSPAREIEGKLLFTHAHPNIRLGEKFKYVNFHYPRRKENSSDEVEFCIQKQDEGIFDSFSQDVCFVGHTHISGILFSEEDYPDFFNYSKQEVPIKVGASRRAIINPGSVGQPREPSEVILWGTSSIDEIQASRISRYAKYGIYDTQECLFHPRAVPYDNFATATQILNLGFSFSSAIRLISFYDWDKFREEYDGVVRKEEIRVA